jgi:hypothetical protein
MIEIEVETGHPTNGIGIVIGEMEVEENGTVMDDDSDTQHWSRRYIL